MQDVEYFPADGISDDPHGKAASVQGRGEVVQNFHAGFAEADGRKNS
jgi:hypothetical protein